MTILSLVILVAFDKARGEAEEKRREGIAEKVSEVVETRERNEKGQLKANAQDGRTTSAHPGGDTTDKPKRQQNNENRTAHTLAQQAGVSRAVMEKALAIKNHDETHGTRYVEQIKAGKCNDRCNSQTG